MRFIVLPIIVSRDGKVPHQLASQIVATVKSAALATEPERPEKSRVGRPPNPPKCAKSTGEVIGAFIGEQCEVGGDKWCTISEMWRAFTRYMCRKYGCMAISRESFAIELSQRGFVHARHRKAGPNHKQARTWEGIRVLNDLRAPACDETAVSDRREYDDLEDHLAKTLELLKKRAGA